jgi:putative transposase
MSAQPRNPISPSWLPLAEFITLADMPRRTVFRHQASGKVLTRKDGKTLLISSSSLPVAAQAKLQRLHTASAPRQLMKITPALPPVSPLFAATEAQDSRQRLMLQPGQMATAEERLRILQPLLDFCNDPSSRSRFECLRVGGNPVRTANDLAAYLAQTHSTTDQPISVRTLWRWKARFEMRGGIVNLARKERADKGRAQWVERFPEAAKLAAAVYTSSHQTKQQAYDTILLNLAKLGMGDSDLPSYSSVCNWLKTIPAPAVVLGRLGEKAHNERMAPYLRRKYTDMAANEVWVSDTMLHDVLVRDDCFNRDNAAVRLQLTAIMDMRSRKMVGYTWVLDGSSRSITTALIRAVRAYGPCLSFYCDNGKDFKKVARFARPANANKLLDEDMQAIERTGALRQLGMGVTFCIKYRPQSKPIERFFGTLHKRFDALFPHYTTGNAYNRPEQTTQAAAQHGKLLRFGAPQSSPLLPASDFVRMAQTWIEQDYNNGHDHDGAGMDKRTPNEVFAEGYPHPRTIDSSLLDMLLWRRERRKVRECSVTIEGRRLVGASTFAAEQLYRANEAEVIVCFDPNDAELGVVLDLDGHKLCDVRAEVFTTQGSDAGPLISASLQQSRSLRNNTAASLRNLRKHVAGQGYTTGAQDIAARAQLPAPLDPRTAENITAPIAVAATGTYGKQLHSEDLGDILAASMRRRADGTDR